MALKHILARISSTTGLNVNVTTQREFIVTEVNEAAKEIYNTKDLINCDREQIFNFGVDQQQVVLPSYVRNVIAAREYDYRMPISQVGMGTRFRTSDWSGYDIFTWREKQREYPLSRDFTNEGPFRIRFTQPCNAQVVVIVTGATEDSARATERLTFNIGDQEKTTVRSWLSTGVESISKSRPTDFDLKVYDIDDNEISSILNYDEKASFLLLNIQDRFQMNTPQRLCEVLFTVKYVPMINDQDIFVPGEMYDLAIYWKTLERLYSRRQDAESMQLANACSLKTDDLINKIAEMYNEGKIFKATFALDATYSMMDNLEFQNIPYSSSSSTWQR